MAGVIITIHLPNKEKREGLKGHSCCKYKAKHIQYLETALV